MSCQAGTWKAMRVNHRKYSMSLSEYRRCLKKGSPSAGSAFLSARSRDPGERPGRPVLNGDSPDALREAIKRACAEGEKVGERTRDASPADTGGAPIWLRSGCGALSN
jgi:hypothetical protein